MVPQSSQSPSLKMWNYPELCPLLYSPYLVSHQIVLTSVYIGFSPISYKLLKDKNCVLLSFLCPHHGMDAKNIIGIQKVCIQ